MLLIGERIQEYRKARGLNQEEFAEKIGVSRQAVSKWERDKAYPDLDRVVCICEILDISIDELIYGQNATEKINTTVHLIGEIADGFESVKLFCQIGNSQIHKGFTSKICCHFVRPRQRV